MPETECETYGVEDPRITEIDGRYYFTYVAVSPHGAATALASTDDFAHFERHGIIFPSENKDVVLFPERINGLFTAFHRPNPATLFSPPEMWLATSNDLTHWGSNAPFHAGASPWETGRIGGGTPPVPFDDAWLAIYHGNSKEHGARGIGVYAAGALLLEHNDPSRILKRAADPVMMPETPFERQGFVPDVVFPTGIVDLGHTYLIYYGAADTCTGVVEFAKDDLRAALA